MVGSDALVAALSGCEVSQINWRNHFFATSSGCLHGTATLRNGIGVHNNVLYTGAYGYRPSDPHCCSSAYDIYRWGWNGHGFTPVDVSSRGSPPYAPY